MVASASDGMALRESTNDFMKRSRWNTPHTLVAPSFPMPQELRLSICKDALGETKHRAFEFKQKKTIVKTKVVIDGKEYYGEGTNKTTATSTLLQLQDENLPFERTEFSVALKKSLEDALIH